MTSRESLYIVALGEVVESNGSIVKCLLSHMNCSVTAFQNLLTEIESKTKTYGIR